MNIFSLFPAFIVTAIILVVMLTEIIKKIDKRNFLKGYRVYIPVILSAGAAWLLRIGNFFAPEQYWFWWATIFGFSVFAFEAILKKIENILNKNG